MINQRWSLSTATFLICLVIIYHSTQGAVIKETGKRTKREVEIERTNWTELADEWLRAKGRIADKFDALLPTTGELRELPPTAETVINGMRREDMSRANYSRMLWDMENVQQGGHLSLFVDKAMKLLDLRQVMVEVETSVMSKVSCTACKVGAGLLQHYIKSGKSDKEIMKSIYSFCVSLNIQSPRVCQGVTLLFGGEVIYVLKQVNMGASQICSFVIGDACDDAYNPQHEWEVAFPPVKKPIVRQPIAPREGARTFKVLHISDTHYDPYYQEGSNAVCNEPLCCRLTNGPASSSATAAGKWGDYRKCDTPKRTVDHMLKHIQDTHPDIDYILWTGDLPPHDVWNQTREENLKILRDTVTQMLETFPGVPIFPALGNHESAPVNSFPPTFVPEENSISWLYDELDKQWRRWLPAGVSHTVRRGAFYSVLVRPGFRILSVNTNYCNNKNWWLLINSTDPANELQWLVYELQGAEMNGEKVHIIGHIPPGHSDCLKVWSRNYYSIINRYESTITAQFFGHTHFDEFELFYDTADLGRAVSIAYIGPSVSPYYDLNPGYRIYYVDGDDKHTTRMVVDHESWVMNLKEANLYDFPIWHKLYSARHAYQMSSLLPRDWDGLIDKMTNEPSNFDLYYKHYYKNSPVRPNCNDECRKRLLCDLRSGHEKDIDYILWTGDLPPHDVWNQTREENLKILRDTVTQMLETFPGVPIFPALGNHESAPVNSFPPTFVPEENSISWLYDELDKQWRRWLPAGVSHTVRRGAFYSVLVRPGFRILSVNTNYCNNKNWWLLINSTDPANELQWLVYELQGAEMNGEKVHIIGHIPPGHSDCLKVWSRNYYSIINRYESTITAQFFGHTHFDEFELFYDTADLGRAVSIAYIGPSVSPYYDLNPGYRIYYVDGDDKHTTRMVVDHESWVMNLKEANLYDFPIWHKLYSARHAYQMSSLLPRDWDGLIDKMTNEPSNFDLYYKHYYKNSPVRPNCNDECRKRLLCDLRSGRSHDRKALCQSLESRIDGETRTSWKEWIYNGLALSMSVVMAIPRFAYNLPKYVLGLG